MSALGDIAVVGEKLKKDIAFSEKPELREELLRHLLGGEVSRRLPLQIIHALIVSYLLADHDLQYKGTRSVSIVVRKALSGYGVREGDNFCAETLIDDMLVMYESRRKAWAFAHPGLFEEVIEKYCMHWVMCEVYFLRENLMIYSRYLWSLVAAVSVLSFGILGEPLSQNASPEERQQEVVRAQETFVAVVYALERRLTRSSAMVTWLNDQLDNHQITSLAHLIVLARFVGIAA
jgi:hypothetical protein